MFYYWYNTTESRPHPHNPVIDQIVSEKTNFTNNRIKTLSLRQLHEEVPKLYWKNYIKYNCLNSSLRYDRYVWRNEDWKEIYTEFPLFEIIKNGLEL